MARKPKTPPGAIVITADEAKALFVGMQRYAIGRMSYFPSWACEIITRHWDVLNEGTRECIRRDVEEAIQRDNDARERGEEYKPLGMDCDRATWIRLAELWREPKPESEGDDAK